MRRRIKERLLVEAAHLELGGWVSARQIVAQRLLPIETVDHVFQRGPELVRRIVTAQPQRLAAISVIENQRGGEMGAFAHRKLPFRKHPTFHVNHLARSPDVDGYHVEMPARVGHDVPLAAPVDFQERLTVRTVRLAEIDDESLFAVRDGFAQVFSQIEERGLEPGRMFHPAPGGHIVDSGNVESVFQIGGRLARDQASSSEGAPEQGQKQAPDHSSTSIPPM